MKRSLLATSCAGFLALASSAMGVDDPLRLRPGAPVPSASSLLPSAVSTGLIQQIDPSTLVGRGLITFHDVAGGSGPGTNYDGILTSGGAQFAERFVGQALSTLSVPFSGDFDVLSDSASNPLALQVGAPNQNLDVFTDIFGDNILAGLGPVGFPDLDAIGAGSVALLFSSDKSEVGFDVFGIDGGGSITIDFFRRDGSLIDTISIPTVAGTDVVTLSFQRVPTINDIAGFSIQNTDPAGLGYDNIRFGTSMVTPLPALSSMTLALLITLLGLVGMLALRGSSSPPPRPP
jgi:hypothetical protein